MAFPKVQNPFKKEKKIMPNYHQAAGEWDNRIGSARVQAKNWRLLALSNVFITTCLIGALAYQTQQSTVEAFVVPVSEIGKPGEITLMADHYQPQKAEVSYFLADWIKKVRSKSVDPIVIRENWLKAYDFLSPVAAQTLNEYAENNDPFANVGQEAKNVEVSSVVQRTDNTYQIQWRELLYANGVQVQQDSYTGLFTIEVNPPKDREAMFKNPLGIYITNLSWEREL